MQLFQIGILRNMEKSLKKQYSNYDNIFLINAIYEQRELDIIRFTAFCYIHTHSACGTAPSLVEAMYLGLPVFSFDVPANRATTENKAYILRMRKY